MGFEHSPPDQYVTPDGKPLGLAVEIMDAAARRRNFHLQWVEAGASDGQLTFRYAEQARPAAGIDTKDQEIR